MNSILPTGKNSFYELRFHSIGGQGAYTTGQMLARTAANIEEIKTGIFASYGSEKKGAPVNVFVRMLESEDKITNYSAVTTPDVVVVFHEQLLKTQNVLSGIKDNGVLIVNTPLDIQTLADTYGLNAHKIITVDATKIGVETGAKINTIMYGAILKELTFLDYELAKSQIRAMLEYKYPQLVESNITAFEAGHNQTQSATNITTGTTPTFKPVDQLGYDNQIPGGLILGANAQFVDRSISREGYLPTFDQEKCINCTKCDSTCPDDCFVWEEVEGRRGRMQMVLQGIDYNFCKGCLRCVEACPTEALSTSVETRGFAEANTKKKVFDFIK